MVDGPWVGKHLPYGMVKQRLEALNCREVERITETSRRWEAPTGFTFTISMSEIDSETLAGIVETVLRSAEHSPS